MEAYLVAKWLTGVASLCGCAWCTNAGKGEVDPLMLTLWHQEADAESAAILNLLNDG